MKNRILPFLASIALLSLASCTDEVQELAGEQSQVLKQIVMTTQDFQTEAGSRTLYEVIENVKCTWADNDTVGVFPNEGAQVYFPMASGAGTKNATFNGGGWALKDGSTYGAYYPCIGKFYLDKNAVPVNYTGQMQEGNASMAHLGAYDYMVATPTAPQDGAAQFTFKHLSALVQLKITVPQPATFTSVKLVTDTKTFAVEGTVDIMADAPSITPVTSSKEFVLNLQDVTTTKENEVVTCYFMLPPADLSEQTLKAVLVSDRGNVEIDFESKNFKAGTAYALSGEMESTVAGYKDGVVTIAEAGTMKQLLGDDYLNITSLKVVGPINGDDVRCLRQMLGSDDNSESVWGKLVTLDLSEASIVVGGGWYYKDNINYEYYYTSNDIIGDYMFRKCANLQHMVLPDRATEIGNYAFAWCFSLNSLTIGSSVVSIGDRGFYRCTSLTSINIPNRVISIGEYAFYDCLWLSSVDIPEGVTTINKGTFSGCTSLVSVVMGDGVTSIGSGAFQGCSSLTSINMPDGITSIDDNAFYECSSLTSLDIPDGVISIGYYAFYGCSSLTSLDIPDGVTSINQAVFYNCYSLLSLNIPDGVTTIGAKAFYGCSSLTSINIPADVTSIGQEAFYYCSRLSSVYITDLSAWCDIKFNDYCSNPLYRGTQLYLNNEELTELVIPADIKRIKDYAFYGCKSITKVTMGEGVTSVGVQSFRECSSLTQVYCYGTTPPTINPSSTNSSFNGSSDKRTLYVPKGYLSAYQSSSWANYFGTITEME